MARGPTPPSPGSQTARRHAELDQIASHVSEKGVTTKRPPARPQKGPGGPPPRRQDVKRYPGGQIRYDHRFQIDQGSEYLAAQRLRPVAPDLSERALHNLQSSAALLRRIGRRMPTRDEEATLIGYAESMKIISAAANKPNLSFPLGIARECGFISRGEFEAGKHYASLYRAVWGRLRDDIEQALGPENFNLLLSIGRVASPPPPASHFRPLVAGNPLERKVESEEEYQKRRETAGHRLGQACAILKADMWIHAVVDGVVILGNSQPFLCSRRIETADDTMRVKALKTGLAALARHFGFDKLDEQDRSGEKSSSAAKAEPHQTNGRARAPGRGLEILFNPQRDGRPSDRDVVAATARLLGKSPEEHNDAER